MGAYAPLPWLPVGTVDEVVRMIAEPTVRAMRGAGTPFAGLLYVGLALTARGPRVVEFNARFGDPETQVVLALLDSPSVACSSPQRPANCIATLRWPGAAARRSPSLSPRPDTRPLRRPEM